MLVFLEPTEREVVSVYCISGCIFKQNSDLNSNNIFLEDTNHIFMPTISNCKKMSVLFHFDLKLCLSGRRENLTLGY